MSARNIIEQPSERKFIKLGGHLASFRGVAEGDPYIEELRSGYEPVFYEIVKTVVVKDGVCLDIGANIGVKTFIMSKHTSGTVLSVEAGPSVSKILLRNVAENGLNNVKVENAALSDQTKEVEFSEYSAWGRMGIVAGHNVKSVARPHMRKREYVVSRIQAYSLEDLLLKHALDRIDFMKIDTEGYDFNIICGNWPKIKALDPWIYFEFGAVGLMAVADVNPKKALSWLFSHFKHVFLISKEEPCRLKPLEAGNIFGFLMDHFYIYDGLNDLLVTNRDDALDIVQEFVADTQPIPLSEEIKKAKEELAALRRSKSWRLTAPLRWSMGKLRRLTKRRAS